jgi:hypothetical protein
MKNLVLLLFLSIPSTSLCGQQIAETDLARSTSSAPSIYDSDVVPEGCKSPHYTNSDGELGHPKLALSVELKLLKEPKLRVAETVQAIVLLRNTGHETIEIPWNSDPLTQREASGIMRHEYEEGFFEIELHGLGKMSVPLEIESVSMPLYSALSVPGSSLRIEPGQWITAKLSFVLEEDRKLSVMLPIEAGSAELRAEWRQVRFTWNASGCEVRHRYYSHRYREERKAVGVEVSK